MARMVCFAHSHCYTRSANGRTTLYELATSNMDGKYSAINMAAMGSFCGYIYLYIPLLLFPFEETFGT